MTEFNSAARRDGPDVETATACRAEGRWGCVASAECARDAGVWAKPGAGEAVLGRAQHVAGLWRRRPMASARRHHGVRGNRGGRDIVMADS